MLSSFARSPLLTATTCSLIKRFFFVDRGDYLSHFLDLAYDQLRLTPASQTSEDRLQALFDISVRCSSIGDSDACDSGDLGGVRVSVCRSTVVDQLIKVLDVLGGGTADDEQLGGSRNNSNSNDIDGLYPRALTGQSRIGLWLRCLP